MSEIKVTPLLGLQENGKSSTLVKIGGKNVILDCGLTLEALNDDNYDQLLPDFTFLFGNNAVNTPIDCVIISHYHLDHSGALPYLTEKIGYKGPIYMTQPTKTIAPFVWKDCHTTLTDANFFPDFLSPSQIADCMSKVTTVAYNEVISINDEITVTVYPSNLPLGPDIFHLEVGQQSIFYHGGCNLKPYSKPPISSPSPYPRVNGNISDGISSAASSSNLPSQQSDLTIKQNGCMLSFKIGQSVVHRQMSPQEMQLITAVFKNLQFMVEDNEDEFWQRIAYEMTLFSSPLNDDSKLRWKTLFYDSLRSCRQKAPENSENEETNQNGLDEENRPESTNEVATKSSGKKNRKKKKAKKSRNTQPSDDLIQFDSPEVEVPSTPNKPKISSNRNFQPNPGILDDQQLMICAFSERLKSAKISPEFWISLNQDLKKKGKSIKPSDLEEYFKRLSGIQMEIMMTSNSFIEAAGKWQHFIPLNDLDLSYFFEDKWAYRRSKARFLDTDETPKPRAKKTKNKAKCLNSPPESPVYLAPINHSHCDIVQQPESPKEIPYISDPEDLTDHLTLINLFANRLRKSEICPEFWTLLHKDLENIGKPLKDEADLRCHLKSLADIQLDVMKTSPDIITAIQKWPFFMMLHDLPLDFLLDDKWAYRRLKPNFS